MFMYKAKPLVIFMFMLYHQNNKKFNKKLSKSKLTE